MWLTEMNGFPAAMARALAVVLPTRRDEARPGPAVAPKASISSILTPAFFNAKSMRGRRFSEWFLLASSGTTPPNSRWISI